MSGGVAGWLVGVTAHHILTGEPVDSEAVYMPAALAATWPAQLKAPSRHVARRTSTRRSTHRRLLSSRGFAWQGACPRTCRGQSFGHVGRGGPLLFVRLPASPMGNPWLPPWRLPARAPFGVGHHTGLRVKLCHIGLPLTCTGRAVPSHVVESMASLVWAAAWPGPCCGRAHCQAQTVELLSTVCVYDQLERIRSV